MQSLLQDLRFSLRVLARHRGFTATSILVLALGIGINAGIFTLINSLLLRPRVSSGAPGTIVGLHSLERGAAGSSRAFSYPNFEDLRAARGPFTHLAAHNLTMAGITEGETTRRAMVDIVSANYFETLGVALSRGRTFTAEEERPGAPASVAIASYSEWARTGFADDVLGRTTVLNGRPYTIVGVAPRGFGGTTVVVEPDFYVPLSTHDLIEWDLISGAQKTLARRDYHRLLLVGRLPPGISIDAADRDMAAIARRMEEAFPAENARQDLIVRPLSRLNISTSPSDDRQLYGPVALLQGLGGVVLLISCLNLANMMLAHGVSRSKEMAIRQAIGGGRARLVRQLVTEGFVLAAAGGGFGLVAAYIGSAVLLGSLTRIMPVTIALQPALDVRVVLATVAFAALATVTFGLWPAVRLSRTDTIRALNDQTAGMGGARRWFSTANLLVTAQMALSLALLILSALFVRAAALGAEANPGFALDRTVHAEVDPGLAGMDETKGREVRRHLLERLRSTPGVEAATVASVIPFGDVSITRRVQAEGPRLRGNEPGASGKLVGAQYLHRRGRLLPHARHRGDRRPRIHGCRRVALGRCRPRHRRRAPRPPAVSRREPDRPSPPVWDRRRRDGRRSADGDRRTCRADPARHVRARARATPLSGVRAGIRLHHASARPRGARHRAGEPDRHGAGRDSRGRAGAARLYGLDAGGTPRPQHSAVVPAYCRTAVRHPRRRGGLSCSGRPLRGQELRGLAPNAGVRRASGARCYADRHRAPGAS